MVPVAERGDGMASLHRYLVQGPCGLPWIASISRKSVTSSLNRSPSRLISSDLESTTSKRATFEIGQSPHPPGENPVWTRICRGKALVGSLAIACLSFPE